MPTYLEDELNRRRMKTGETLSSYKSSIAPDIEKTRSGIGSMRKQFLESSVIPNISGMTGYNQAIGRETSNLERNLGTKLAGRKRQEQTTGVQRTFDVAFQRAQDAGLDYQDAVNYARNVALQQQEMTGKSQIAEMERQGQLGIQDIKDRYMQDQTALQQRYATTPDYSGAMYRALFGLAGTAGTATGLYYLGKKTGNTNTNTNNKFFNSDYVNDYGNVG